MEETWSVTEDTLSVTEEALFVTEDTRFVMKKPWFDTKETMFLMEGTGFVAGEPFFETDKRCSTGIIGNVVAHDPSGCGALAALRRFMLQIRDFRILEPSHEPLLCAFARLINAG